MGYRLDQVFGFAGIAENPQRNVQDQTMVAVEKDGKSVVMPRRKMQHQGLVRLPCQLAVRKRLPLQKASVFVQIAHETRTRDTLVFLQNSELPLSISQGENLRKAPDQ
jgi:hypothetical protein